MGRINQEKFDLLIIELLHDCVNLAECDCDCCNQLWILYQKLKEQNTENTPGIMNTLREMVLDEFIARDNAVRNGPRYNELSPQDYYNILSNKHYFRLDIDNELYAIY